MHSDSWLRNVIPCFRSHLNGKFKEFSLILSLVVTFALPWRSPFKSIHSILIFSPATLKFGLHKGLVISQGIDIEIIRKEKSVLTFAANPVPAQLCRRDKLFVFFRNEFLLLFLFLFLVKFVDINPCWRCKSSKTFCLWGIGSCKRRDFQRGIAMGIWLCFGQKCTDI